MATIGWKLHSSEREKLLQQFPPSWPDIVADHVTFKANTTAEHALPEVRKGIIIGSVDDGEGLQVLVVAINGSTKRQDGKVYHITWSLDKSRGRRASDSNVVLKREKFTELERPVPISLIPSRF